MTVSLEISLYPFADDYSEDVNVFLEKLHSQADIQIETNSMSTIITGDYKVIMNLALKEFETFFNNNKAVFVMKLSNGCVV